MYYFGYTALIISLIACFYLFDRYRRQRVKNLTTLLWSLAFLALASSIWSTVVLVLVGQYLFAGLALVLFYIGTARLITKNLFHRFIFPLLFYGIVSLLIGWKVSQVKTVFVFLLLLPFSLVLVVMFFSFYRHLCLTNQPKKSRHGAFLLALSWFLFLLLSISLIFVQNPSAMDIWFGFLALIELTILIGIRFLEKGAKQSAELHLRMHGLRKRKEG